MTWRSERCPRVAQVTLKCSHGSAVRNRAKIRQRSDARNVGNEDKRGRWHVTLRALHTAGARVAYCAKHVFVWETMTNAQFVAKDAHNIAAHTLADAEIATSDSNAFAHQSIRRWQEMWQIHTSQRPMNVRYIMRILSSITDESTTTNAANIAQNATAPASDGNGPATTASHSDFAFFSPPTRFMHRITPISSRGCDWIDGFPAEARNRSPTHERTAVRSNRNAFVARDLRDEHVAAKTPCLQGQSSHAIHAIKCTHWACKFAKRNGNEEMRAKIVRNGGEKRPLRREKQEQRHFSTNDRYHRRK